MKARDLEGETVQAGSAQVTVGSRLDEGGEGVVYSIDGSTNEVIKVLFQKCRSEKEQKVEAMVQNPPEDPNKDQLEVPSLVWPLEIVKEPQSGGFLGYAMPYIDTDQYREAQLYARDELDWDKSDQRLRYKTALNFSLTVALLHTQGHAIGDLNHLNILVNNGHICMIDCDGFHIKGQNAVYNGSTYHPRYAPPDTYTVQEYGRNLQEVQHADQFGLAVHNFQFLMRGCHPFQSIGDESTHGHLKDQIKNDRFPYKNPVPDELEPPPYAPDYSQIPQPLQNLFEKCFQYGKTRPRHRPSALEWVHTLRAVSSLQERQTTESRVKKWEKQRKMRRQGSEDPSGTWAETIRNDEDTDSASTQSTSTSSTQGGKNWAEKIRDIEGGDNDDNFSNSSPNSTVQTNMTSSTNTSGSSSPLSSFEVALRVAMYLLIIIMVILLIVNASSP